MVNPEKFADRLQRILDYHELSAASFADKIAVGRSSISHILSGRNKPSLDFITKIAGAFPDIELEWLLFGKGNFPKPINEEALPFAPSNSQEHKTEAFAKTFVGKSSKIKKIVFIYENGHFEVFEN